MSGFFHDLGVTFRRSATLSLQNPVWMLISLLQPILYLGLFGPLLERVAQTPGFPPGDAWQVFVPGLLVQLGIFGTSFVGFGIIAEYRSGVIDRLLVSPANRTAMMAGTVLRDVVMVTFQGVILIGAGFLFGLRVPFPAMISALAVVAILGGTFAFLSYSAGLWLKSEDALAPLVNSFALPILLLSGILLPMTLAPRWLQIVSDINPIKHIVDAIRALFRSDFGNSDIVLGVGLAVALLLIGSFVGSRTFRGMTK